MMSRTTAATIAAAIATVLLAPGLAGARGGSGSAHGFARFGAHAFVHHGAVRRAHGVSARHDARQGHRFDRSYWPAVIGDGLMYAADDMVDDTDSRPGRLAIYRPACRLRAEVRLVAAESGGEREIVITRCIVPLGLAAAPPPPAGAAENGEPASEPPAALEDRRTCRVRTSVVVAEDGGERTVSVRRC